MSPVSRGAKNSLAVPAGRTGAFRRSTPLTRGSQNIANNTPPPVVALWADRNRSRGGSQCGIRLFLPIRRDKAHRKGADGGTLCLDHTTHRAPAPRGRGTGWQCALRREGVELRNHHSEPYLLCTTAPDVCPLILGCLGKTRTNSQKPAPD